MEGTKQSTLVVFDNRSKINAPLNIYFGWATELIMPYQPADTQYHTPTRPSRHEYPYYRQPPSISETGTVNHSPYRTASNYQSTSPARLRPKAHKLSRSLLSLVSKFEALEATSTPYDIPSLQPAHLKLHSNSSKGRKPSGKQQQRKRLPTIFSPPNKAIYKRQSPVDKVAVTPEKVTENSPIVHDPVKKSGSGRLKQVSSPQRKFSLRLRHVDGGGSSDPVSVPREQNENKDKRRSTVRDGIKFWNGGFDKANATSRPLPVYRPAPRNSSVVAPYSRTPVKESVELSSKGSVTFPLKKRKGHKRTPCTNSACVKRQEASLAKTAAASIRLSTMTDQHSTSKIRKLHLQDPEPNPFEEKEERTTATIRKETPELSPKTNLVEKLLTSPKSAQSVPHRTSVAKEKPLVKEDSSTSERSSKSRLPRAVKTRIVENGMRDISNKIEAVYSAKRAEKSAEIMGISSKELDPSPSKLRERKEIFEPPTPKQPSRAPTRQASRVASMKNLFDGNRTEETTHKPSLASPPKTSIVLPKISSIIYEKLKDEVPKYRWAVPSRLELAKPSPPVTQPLPLSRIPRFSPTASKSTFDVQSTPRKKNFMTTGKQMFPPIVKNRPSKPETFAIGDKIKLFQAPSEMQTQASRILRQPSASMRLRTSQFENPSVKEVAKSQGKILSAKEVQDMVNELRDREAASRTTPKGHTAQGSRSQQSMASTGTGMSARLDGASPSVRDMIVKEVKCGLRQPKPVRLDEVRRMVSLCRSNIGVVYKDKSRAVRPK